MPPPSDSRRVRAARKLFGHLACEDPHLHADGAVGRLGRRRRVIDVGAERVQRYPPLVVALGARDLGAAQATGRLDLDPLRSHPHRALHRALHGAPERDALRQLMRHGVRHELRVQLRPLDLLDVDAHFLAGELGQLVAQLVHLPAALADHHAGTARVHRDRDLPRLALDVNVGDGRMGEPGLQVLPDQVVFLQELGEVVTRVVARAPRLNDPEPESVGVCFLAHLSVLFLLLGFRRLLCLRRLAPLRSRPYGRGCGLRLRPGLRRRGLRGPGFRVPFHVDLGVARPIAAGVKRLRVGPSFTTAYLTRSWSTSSAVFSRSARCSAFATADLSTLWICFAASFFENRRMAYACGTAWPRIWSITRRIFRADWRTVRWIARASMV